MKSKILYIILAVLIPAPFLSAKTVREAFLTAPREVIYSIDSLGRLDMLDYWDSGMARGVTDDFGSKLLIKQMTDNSMTMTASESSEITINLVTAGCDTMLMSVKTISLPVPDCRVTLYDKEWNPLPARAQIPTHNDLDLWLTGDWKPRIDDIENAVPFITATCYYDDNNKMLTMVQTVPALVSREDKEIVSGYLRPTISYTWNGKKWKRGK